jgi:hypothetical protein
MRVYLSIAKAMVRAPLRVKEIALPYLWKFEVMGRYPRVLLRDQNPTREKIRPDFDTGHESVYNARSVHGARF